VLEEFIDLRNTGQVLASLELATAEVADLYRERAGDLEAWNFRSEQAEPCEEVPVGRGTYRCRMLESTDFHSVGGLTPWVDRMTATIDEAGLITDVSHDIVNFDSGVQVFNTRFQRWLADAHPDAAEEMNGVVMTRSFAAQDALIALEYVEEFIAQSDTYPLEATSGE
jgi:hypothetical protein